MSIQHAIYARQNLVKTLDCLHKGDEEGVERFVKRAIAELKSITPSSLPHKDGK